MGTASLLSSILNLRMVGSLAAQEMPPEEDYRALVCVFLAGGNDSFNMLAPVDEDGHAEYLAARGGIGLPAGSFLALDEPLPDGRTLGLQSTMPELHALYQAGKAGFVANVGTLVEPTTLAGFQSGEAALPLGLFSHLDQQMHWQSTLPESRSAAAGFAARMADLLQELNASNSVSMNISVAGLNLFQSGGATGVMAVDPAGVPQLTDWNHASFLDRRHAVESLLESEYRNVYERAFASLKRDAIATGSEFKAAIDGVGALQQTFTGDNPLSQQLSMVARTIAARSSLGKSRQTFFVLLGGWDMHDGMAGHPGLLSILSEAIGEFQGAMAELGTEDKVTLFTASDFARTLSSNGNGTDHAWGGNQVVVGGAVAKGVHGSYPELSLGSLLDTGRGRLIPTTSVDEYFADLALWMGVAPSSMGLVLPNLHRFDDLSDGAPLGLFAGG